MPAGVRLVVCINRSPGAGQRPCEQGPTMRIAPGGLFFTETDDAALAVIVDELENHIEITA